MEAPSDLSGRSVSMGFSCAHHSKPEIEITKTSKKRDIAVIISYRFAFAFYIN